MDLALNNGKVFFEGSLQEKNIGIEKGKIKEIKSGNIEAEKIIDCKNLIILPGLLDSHVHFREPGLEWKEDWLTGSSAAAAGGVTTVLDMPNTKPPTTTTELLVEKRALAKKSIVNYGFHFGAAEGNADEIIKAWDMNIASVKVFMNISTGKMMIENESTLEEVFMNSRLVSVHAEGEKLKHALELQKKFGNRLYVCHVSSKEELNYLKGSKAFVEVTPHHLFLNLKDVKDSFREMHPSLKSEGDRAALWNAIKTGLVATIGTDHAPHTKEEKLCENPPRGIPGVETMLALLLNAVNEGKISLGKVVELCSENPAKIFGIRNKGKIAIGFDADLAVIDLKKERTVNGVEMFSKCKWSPFDGLKLKGLASKTIVNGSIVYDNGNIIGKVKGREVEIGG